MHNIRASLSVSQKERMKLKNKEKDRILFTTSEPTNKIYTLAELSVESQSHRSWPHKY